MNPTRCSTVNELENVNLAAQNNTQHDIPRKHDVDGYSAHHSLWPGLNGLRVARRALGVLTQEPDRPLLPGGRSQRPLGAQSLGTAPLARCQA